MQCRINNLTKPPGYVPRGIRSIRLLDYDDFITLRFDAQNGGLYNNNLVTAILGECDFIDLETASTAKYSLSQQNGQYVHTLETSLDALNGAILSDLDLAAKQRRYVVLFGVTDNRYFLFGSDTGALLTYSLQTEEAIGAAIKLSAVTPCSLFEVTAEAAASAGKRPIDVYAPNNTESECELVDEKTTGILQYRYMMRVSAKSGAALDANGDFCSVSGNPQAYRKLDGADNLTGNVELAGTYAACAQINGVPTCTFSPVSCPICMEESISISPNQITVYAGYTEQVNLTSKGAWNGELSGEPVAVPDITNGAAGVYQLKITGKAPGTCTFIFTNVQTGSYASLEVISISPEWILQTGTWNDNGRWMDTALWGN